MADWISSIARGYAAGSAIGQDIRTGAAQRRIEKNLPKFAQLDRDYSLAMEQGDTELANQLKAQRDQIGTEVYRAADRLNALTGSQEGTQYLNTVMDSYSNPDIPQKPSLLQRTRSAIGLDKPKSYNPEAVQPATTTAPGGDDPKLQQYAALDSDYQKALAMGDTPLAEQIKAERNALNIDEGYQAIPTSSRVSAIAGDNPFEQLYGQLGFRKRLSESAGRQFDPGQEEEINAKAASYIYGNNFAPARDQAVKTFTSDGRWTNEQAHQIAGSIKALALHIPQYRQAVIEVDEATGHIYIDETGGDSADATVIRSPQDLSMADDIFARLQKPSGLLGRNMEAQQAEAARRSDFTTAANTKLLEAGLKIISEAGVSKESQAVVAKMAEAGFKNTPMTPEEQETYKTEGTSWQTKVDTEAGTYLIGRKMKQGTEKNPVYEVVIYDTSKGNVVPDNTEWAKYIDSKRTNSAGSAVEVIRAFEAAAQAKIDDINTGIDLFNSAVGSAMTGRAPVLAARNDSGIARRGADGATSGSRDENGFPTANRQNNRGARNLNPLNLKDTDGKFRQFSSIDEGFAAAEAQLMRYYEGKGVAERPLRTVTDIISKWAPPSDKNDTRGYIDMVSKELGVAPNQEINLRDPVIRQALVQAMARMETGWQNPYGSAPDAGSRLAAAVVPPSGRPTSAPVQSASPPEPAAVPPRTAQRPAAPSGAYATMAPGAGAADLSRYGPLPAYATLPHNALNKADGGVILTPDYFNTLRQE